jgi:pimeloyl-ACP methyl ester carboxylesterase
MDSMAGTEIEAASGGGRDHSVDRTGPSPFAITVSDRTLSDLRERLRRTRPAAATPGEPWSKGVDARYLRGLIDYWEDGFDWRATESALNELPHFRASVGGELLHFVWVRGVRAPGQDAPLPLLLTHGWPSSFLEMLPLVPLLTDPGRHGGDPGDAFDLVIPSLPGFAFSTLKTEPLTRAAIADLLKELMVDVLGYPRFGAYGGDIGADVTNWLAIRHAKHLSGIHVIHPKLPTPGLNAEPLSAAEQAYLDRRAVEDELDGGYSAIQATRPDTIAAALNDSPAGLAAWIVDKYRAWSDCDGLIDSRFSHDQLLSIITLYWVTETIASSFRTYVDYPHNPPRPLITVPTGVTLTTEDADYPRSLADRSYSDIRHWREATAGGHFLPLEEPELVAGDIRTFFRPLRAQGTESRRLAT